MVGWMDGWMGSHVYMYGVLSHLCAHRNNRLVKERVESLPGFSLIHDMVITKDYYVFFKAPVQIRPLKWLLGLAGVASCIEFNDAQPAVAHLIPRNDPARPRVDIDVDPHFSFHFVSSASPPPPPPLCPCLALLESSRTKSLKKQRKTHPRTIRPTPTTTRGRARWWWTSSACPGSSSPTPTAARGTPSGTTSMDGRTDGRTDGPRSLTLFTRPTTHVH